MKFQTQLRRTSSRDRLAKPWDIQALESRQLLAGDLGPAIDASPSSTAEVVSSDQVSEVDALVFIDQRVDDVQSLLNALPNDADYVLLDPTTDGLTQISEYLGLSRKVKSVHIVSHGADGKLFLGKAEVDTSALQRHAAQLRGWKQALTPDADIRLYGCKVAKGTKGQRFISTFAQLTQADVAASSNTTANRARGGDWELEASVGRIESANVFQPTLLAQYQYSLAESSAVVTTSDEENQTLQSVDASATAAVQAYSFSYPLPETGTEIKVISRGAMGDEQFVVEAGDERSKVSSRGDAFFTFKGSYTASDIKIRFINDLYDPDQGIDRNLTVDAIYVNDVKYETEDAEVFASGVWNPETSQLEEGNFSTETLQGNGYFQYSNAQPTPPGSTIVVNAYGSTGDEKLVLKVTNQTFEAVQVSTTNTSYVFQTRIPATFKGLGVYFINDLYDPANGIDRALIVDNVQIDGVTYETESKNVESSATWSPVSNQVESGFFQTERLDGNGRFSFSDAPPPTPKTVVVVNALGDMGDEQFVLEAGGKAFEPTTVNKTIGSYTFEVDAAVPLSDIRVRYVNDFYDPANGIDRNLVVDRIEVNGVVYQSESPEVFASGVWSSTTGLIESGYLQTERLAANGAFQFGSRSVGENLSIAKSTPLDFTSNLAGYRLRAPIRSDDGRFAAIIQDDVSRKYSVAMFRADGFLDESFGSGGKVSLDDIATSLGVSNTGSKSYGLSFDADGKLLVSGNRLVQTGRLTFVNIGFIFRLDPNGQLDSTFMNRELGEKIFGGTSFDRSGRILLSNNNEITRLLSNGQLDTTYGTNGTVNFGTIIGFNSFFNPIVVGTLFQADGSTVIAIGNYRGDAFERGQPAGKIFKLTADGSQISEFGIDGVVDIESAAFQTEITDAALDENGNILFSTSNTLHRFKSNGDLDLSFGTNGVLKIPQTVIENGLPYSVNIQSIKVDPQGKTLLVGHDRYRAFVIGVTSKGVLDPAVGDDGVLALEGGDYFASSTFGPTFDIDGKTNVIVARRLTGFDRIEYVQKELDFA